MRNLAISKYNPDAVELTGLWTDDDTHLWQVPSGAYIHNNVISQESFKIENVHNEYIYSFNKVQGKPKGVSLAADIAHSIDAYVASEMQVRCAYRRIAGIGRIVEAYRTLEKLGHVPKERVVSPVIIPSLNNYEDIFRHLELPTRLQDEQYLKAMGYMLGNLLRTPSFDEVSVFDEFTCLPNFVGHMKQHYINIMAEIADGELASQICSTIVGEQVIIDKISPDLSKEILRGDYAIS
ncbi:hypothetical protein NVP1188A_67 [Vibrio phage 1.188.A._10N.286.51.A6]|uniref:Uncharacterized protein n=3 Tax=Mukerjeevirus mv51A6 TaxID=2734162 RepID=A0A2I7RJ28_9CAUD|nr:RNA polymerase [Vibrio phage 1.188.A._10N.286.51.A6]AUR93635.1 hypothetical protein NVP1188A_67 [Vibrio phage 1.188.A._10N.286.51.A6]AUR93721.1 hypothetical protein NVP1188B_67 [Vibrio phage 1.188.B._10N.286.51.A6]AUR93807.1 hypothetical protein NVP1188C_67 [Vibrio phage 1.188.C._10N.286.51.A6]